MRSYIKIMGPPVLEAMRRLEDMAVDFPDVCIMDQVLAHGTAPTAAGGGTGSPVYSDVAQQARGYFSARGVTVPSERCNVIISRHGERLGEYDFFFEWFKKPTREQVEELIGKIDVALKSLGCLYTITTR